MTVGCVLMNLRSRHITYAYFFTKNLFLHADAIEKLSVPILISDFFLKSCRSMHLLHQKKNFPSNFTLRFIWRDILADCGRSYFVFLLI